MLSAPYLQRKMKLTHQMMNDALTSTEVVLMTYSEYRNTFKSTEEFMESFGKLSEQEVNELISTMDGSASVKACAFSTWEEARERFIQEKENKH